MSLNPDTSPLPHQDPAGFLRAAYARVTVQADQAELAHQGAVLWHEAVNERARLMPLAYGQAKAAQDWMIASLREVVDAELDEIHVRWAWIDAELDLIRALAAEYGVDLEPVNRDFPGEAGHG